MLRISHLISTLSTPLVLLPCSCQFSIQNPWSGYMCRHWQYEWCGWWCNRVDYALELSLFGCYGKNQSVWLWSTSDFSCSLSAYNCSLQCVVSRSPAHNQERFLVKNYLLDSRVSSSPSWSILEDFPSSRASGEPLTILTTITRAKLPVVNGKLPWLPFV